MTFDPSLSLGTLSLSLCPPRPASLRVFADLTPALRFPLRLFCVCQFGQATVMSYRIKISAIDVRVSKEQRERTYQSNLLRLQTALVQTACLALPHYCPIQYQYHYLPSIVHSSTHSAQQQQLSWIDAPYKFSGWNR